MFAKRAKPGQTRKREEPKAEEAEDDTQVVRDERAGKRMKEALAASSNASKKEKEVAIDGFKADRSVDFKAKAMENATAILETETAYDRDARAVHERNFELSDKLRDGELDLGVYRGANAYRQIIKKGEGAISNAKSSGLLGPVRGNVHARLTMRMDYEPDVCKDYKETGYCGYGDTCKFSHDRSDYKGGWRIEKEYQDQLKAKEERRQRRLEKLRSGADELSENDLSSGDESDSDDDGLPFACFICKEKWHDCTSPPIITVCQHYFCEDCAMRHYQDSKKCACCNAPTGGMFYAAESLIAKVEEKRKMAKMKLEKSVQLKGDAFTHNLDDDVPDSD